MELLTGKKNRWIADCESHKFGDFVWLVRVHTGLQGVLEKYSRFLWFNFINSKMCQNKLLKYHYGKLKSKCFNLVQFNMLYNTILFDVCWSITLFILNLQLCWSLIIIDVHNFGRKIDFMKKFQGIQYSSGLTNVLLAW